MQIVAPYIFIFILDSEEEDFALCFRYQNMVNVFGTSIASLNFSIKIDKNILLFHFNYCSNI